MFVHIPASLASFAKEVITKHPVRKPNHPLQLPLLLQVTKISKKSGSRLYHLVSTLHLNSSASKNPIYSKVKCSRSLKTKNPELIYMRLILYFPSGPQASCQFFCEIPSFLKQNTFTLNLPSLQTCEYGALVSTWNAEICKGFSFLSPPPIISSPLTPAKPSSMV